jgi:hypothetical protein
MPRTDLEVQLELSWPRVLRTPTLVSPRRLRAWCADDAPTLESIERHILRVAAAFG